MLQENFQNKKIRNFYTLTCVNDAKEAGQKVLLHLKGKSEDLVGSIEAKLKSQKENLKKC